MPALQVKEEDMRRGGGSFRGRAAKIGHSRTARQATGHVVQPQLMGGGGSGSGKMGTIGNAGIPSAESLRRMWAAEEDDDDEDEDEDDVVPVSRSALQGAPTAHKGGGDEEEDADDEVDEDIGVEAASESDDEDGSEEEEESDPTRHLYELFAVANHTGGTGGGHYCKTHRHSSFLSVIYYTV